MMGYEEQLRHERDVVAGMYDAMGWREKVATMPTDQVTAIYLRHLRDNWKPAQEIPVVRPIEPPEEPQGKLF